jgi:hypothetical protein
MDNVPTLFFNLCLSYLAFALSYVVLMFLFTLRKD